MLLALLACRDPISVDTTLPEVAITLPLDGAVVRDVVETDATATDGSRVSGLRFELDGDPLGDGEQDPRYKSQYHLDWDSTPYVDGDHRLTAIATDYAGNDGPGSIHVVVYNGSLDPGVMRILYPTDGSTVCRAVPIEALVNASVAEVEFFVDGESLGVDSGEPWLTTWDAPSSGAGTHIVRVLLTTTDGEQIQRETWVDVADDCDAAPSVMLTSPANGGVGTDDALLTASAQDDVGVVKVQFFVDNGIIGEDTTTPWSASLAGLGEGEHVLKALVTDTAGTVSTSGERTFRVDLTPPTVEIVRPADGELVDGVVSVAANADDEVGLRGVNFRVDGAPLGAVLDPPYVLDLDTTTLPAGDHLVEAIAEDTAGNQSTPDGVTITVDNPPDLIIEPADGATVHGDFHITALATDDGAIVSVHAALNGVDLGVPPTQWDWLVNGCALDSGTYTLDVTALDNGGHTVSASSTFTLANDTSAPEICDGADNDCDGEVDEGDDADGDGYQECDGDCDDTNASVSPAAGERCADGIDDDCDGAIDEDDAVDAPTWYLDADGDGYGVATATLTACSTPAGYAGNATDCDDAAADVSPAGTETCDGRDEDCDGVVDEGFDVDGDGVSACDTDCDDTDAAISPFAAELCGDGVDEDCDGLVDEDDAADASTWYADADGDGYGSDVTTRACTNPAGYVANSDDCDDTLATANPHGVETCNGVDDDCSGVADDGFDADGDGVSYCGGADCDDADATIHPGATETCDDHIDQDCDGEPGACTIAGTIALASADAVLRGTAMDDHAGTSIAAAGDVDGDGYGDVLVGAPLEDGGGGSAGAAYLVRGPIAGDTALSSAYAILRGDSASDYAGRSVAGAGDVNGDGHADVLVGADLDDGGASDAGTVYLLTSVTGSASLSTAGTKIRGVNAGDHAGYAVAGGVDVDGDAIPDVVIGAYASDAGGADSGAVYLIGGDVTGSVSLSTADAVLTGEAAGDNAGAAVASVGDVDGDGLGDVLVGAYLSSAGGAQSGIAYLVLGGRSGTIPLASADARLLGEDAADGAGMSVAGAGDVDGDGLADLLVGAFGVDDAGGQSGAAYLVRGAPSGDLDLSLADARLTGESGGDYAGYSVAGAGDVDADGFADVLVGAPSRDDGTTDNGVAYLVRGPFSGTVPLATADARLVGTAYMDVAGIAVSSAGDTDGDGYADVLVGANRADGGASDAGIVYLLTGGGI